MASRTVFRPNRRNIYRILGFTGTQLAINEYADVIQQNVEQLDPDSAYSYDEETTGSGYRRRRTGRIINTSPLGWVTEFGSYGGKRSYELDNRGPYPGFTDEGGPSRMQRSTGRRTGVVKPKFPLLRAALAARGTLEYKPAKVRETP